MLFIKESLLQFSFKIFTEMLERSNGFLISPYSIYNILTILGNGSEEETRLKIFNYLHYPRNLSNINKDFDFLMDRVQSGNSNKAQSRNNFIESINILSYHDDISFQEDFVRNTTFYCHLKLKQFNEKLDLFLDDDFDINISNSVSFRGMWAEQFDSKNTKSILFDNKYKVDMLSQINIFSAYDGNNYLAVKMDYLYSGFSFIAILPKNGLSLLSISSLINQNGYIDNLVRKMSKCKVNITIPKIKCESSDCLMLSGIREILKEPDLSKMISNDHSKNLDLTSLIKFDINENGSGNVEYKSKRDTKNNFKNEWFLEANFNKPFMYFLVKRIQCVKDKDGIEHLPIYMGTYYRPEK